MNYSFSTEYYGVRSLELGPDEYVYIYKGKWQPSRPKAMNERSVLELPS